MNIKRIIILMWLSLICLSPILSLNVRAQTDEAQIIVLTADGPITPAMAQYLSRGIKTAESQGAEATLRQYVRGGVDVEESVECAGYRGEGAAPTGGCRDHPA